ncbi:AAA family ATPase [Pinibacter soli]|uniref:ATP-binding protein n=1 Tax=Pinibacter soli TaxID=3044211 RepID=A0ABT6RDW6_9BACT|nr:ATP-binding protein [Pinibacter soli]MDI3320768.1 ATP-binding protein [Pinibacter soli]
MSLPNPLQKISEFASHLFSNNHDNAGKLFTTQKQWQSLNISPLAKAELNTLQTLVPLNKMCNYVALFEGDDASDKLAAAALMAKDEGRQLYRIDVSQVVSKYAGETEKNLDKVFNNAQSHDWILFFDEADALFAKRTNVKDSHDKYANQDVTYLMHKIEDYKGVVIVATNSMPSDDDDIKKMSRAVITFKRGQA